MRIVITTLFIFLLLAGCSKYPGYKPITSDIYYSLIQFGYKEKRPSAGDYITISIEYRTRDDSVFFFAQRKVKIKSPSDQTSVDHCFLEMNQGDSASFIFPAIKFFKNTLKRNLPEFISPDDIMQMNVRLLEIQSEEEFLFEKHLFLTWSAELSTYEKKILQKFMDKENPGIKPNSDGFYMLTINQGNDCLIKTGDHIWVHYEGKFINGKFFDGTYKSDEPVDFTYGTQFILIPGLEKALAYMSEGQKAIIILPSELAYGEKGDNSGIIPPYTSLIYTLEVIKVEKNYQRRQLN